MSVNTIEDPSRLADLIVAHLNLKLGRQAGDLGDPGSGQAAREALAAHAGRDRDSPGRTPHSFSREEADGALAKRVLSQRTDAGDSEGTRRERRVQG